MIFEFISIKLLEGIISELEKLGCQSVDLEGFLKNKETSKNIKVTKDYIDNFIKNNIELLNIPDIFTDNINEKIKDLKKYNKKNFNITFLNGKYYANGGIYILTKISFTFKNKKYSILLRETVNDIYIPDKFLSLYIKDIIKNYYIIFNYINNLYKQIPYSVEGYFDEIYNSFEFFKYALFFNIRSMKGLDLNILKIKYLKEV